MMINNGVEKFVFEPGMDLFYNNIKLVVNKTSLA